MSLKSKLQHASEQILDVTRGILPWSWGAMTGIRGFGRQLGIRFWPTYHPAAEGTEVNYDLARQLYRNDGDMALGSGFARPIVDVQVSFMGLPTVKVDDEATTNFLNECITDYWADELQQMFRDAIRDSKVIVRMWKPDVLDPLMTLDEAEHVRIECLPPERVDIERNMRNKNVIERALIRHRMIVVTDEGDPTEGRDPITEEHDVIEIIDRQSFSFFDQTESTWLTEMGSVNTWGFVPLLEVFNEWDSSLQSGQSDLETAIPFMRAFHDVLTQGLQAHNYHSTPKVVMNLADVAPFIKNNFPDAIDPDTGELRPQAEISWRGREILFLQQEDKIEFLEAQSVLGDTKTLLEFLIDCICISSQTPEWAFMRVDSGSANSDRNAQTVPLVKKVEKKRRNFASSIQMLCKMALVIYGNIPVRPRVEWEIVRYDDEVVYMQAFQQLVMGLEVARQRGEISDETYMQSLRQFLPAMKATSLEKIDAQADKKKDMLALPPAQPAPPAQPVPVKGGPQGANE